jgi:hypothetical protein
MLENIKVKYDHAGVPSQDIKLNKIYTVEELTTLGFTEGRIKILFKPIDGDFKEIKSETTENIVEQPTNKKKVKNAKENIVDENN